MEIKQRPSRLIEALEIISQRCQKRPLKLSEVLEILGEEGHALMILFFCLPYLQPIPLPGLSTPFGFLISLVAFYMFLHRPPWLPQKFANLLIESHVLNKIIPVAERIWLRVVTILKERLVFLCDYRFFQLLTLVTIVINSLLLALPLPIPFSNTVPVIAIVLNCLGQMERDGLFVLMSYLWTFVVLIFFAALFAGAGAGLHELFSLWST